MKPSSFYLSTTKKVLEDCRSFIDINNQDNDIDKEKYSFWRTRLRTG